MTDDPYIIVTRQHFPRACMHIQRIMLLVLKEYQSLLQYLLVDDTRSTSDTGTVLYLNLYRIERQKYIGVDLLVGRRVADQCGLMMPVGPFPPACSKHTCLSTDIM